MQTHVKVVAGFFIVFAALKLCLAAIAPALLNLIAGIVRASDDPDAATGVAVLHTVAVFAAMYFVIFAIPAIAAGWGLLSNRGWARILAIVLAAFSLVEIPIGTLFGIYALWVLFHKDTEAMFATPAAAPTLS